jgi:hypothetical protein
MPKFKNFLREGSGNSLRLEGLRIYYDFIRPRMALNGKTPAEVTNIDLQLGQNR